MQSWDCFKSLISHQVSDGGWEMYSVWITFQTPIAHWWFPLNWGQTLSAHHHVCFIRLSSLEDELFCTIFEWIQIVHNQLGWLVVQNLNTVCCCLCFSQFGKCQDVLIHFKTIIAHAAHVKQDWNAVQGVNLDIMPKLQYQIPKTYPIYVKLEV